ncbi:hypothetical protein B1P86_01885 [Enterococcus faecium]|nr:hypothetical protein B1P86_01885 [Enterococcus faecium]
MFNQLLLGNKLTSLENMRSYFLTSALITQSITQFHNLFLKRSYSIVAQTCSLYIDDLDVRSVHRRCSDVVVYIDRCSDVRSCTSIDAQTYVASLNGVQKLASAVISPTQQKI